MASGLSPGGYVRQGTRNAPPPRSVNVQVAVRCRPLNEREKLGGERPVILCSSDRREVVCTAPAAQRKGASAVTVANSKKLFTYDNVFDQNASQADVYDQLVEPIVDEVLEGYNCTVFAYGQTGTGKTHTMEGRRDDDILAMSDRRLPENAGIIPRAVKQVFDHLRSITDEHSVRVSHLELYNEQLSDLLSPHDVVSESLRMYEDPQKGTFVQGLEDVVVRSEEEIFAVLDHSATKRRTEETLMNKYSSRSHSVFSITIHIKESTPEGADLLKVGKLNLVDLAGSENVGRSGAVKGRAREAGNINQSLLTLGRVITALVDRHPHIPYRDSKLTRLLQESLGGRNKTCVIATVTPASSSVEETLSTLDYAYRAKSIKNRPTVNQMIAKHVLLKEYTEEISKLKRELDANRTKNGVYMTKEDYDRLVQKTSQQMQSIAQLEERGEDFEKKNSVLKEKLERTQQALLRDRDELTATKSELSVVSADLRSTQTSLAIANQEKEENAHLVASHIASEEKFQVEGKALQSTVRDCLSDIGSLHARVSAKASIEKENVRELGNMQGVVGKGISAVCETLEESRDRQVNMLHASQLKLDELVEGVESGLNSIASRISEFRKEFENVDDETWKKSSRRLAEFDASLARDISSFGTTVSSNQSVMREKALGISAASTSIDTFLSQIGEIVDRTRDSLSERSCEQRSVTDQILQRQEEMSAAFTANIQEGLLNQQRLVKEMKEEVEKDIERQKQTLEATQAEAIQQVQAALETLVTQNTKVMANTAASTEQKLHKFEAEARGLKGALDEHAESIAASREELRHNSAMQQSDLAAVIQEGTSSISAIIDKGQEATSNQETLCGDILNSCTHSTRETQSLLESVQGSFAAYGDEFEKSRSEAVTARALKFSTEASLAADLNFAVRSKAASARSEIVEDLKNNESCAERHVQSTRKQLDLMVQQPVMSHQVLIDTEHDDAPAVREWTYPVELTRTRPHDELLTEFRVRMGYENPVEDFGRRLRLTEGHESDSTLECASVVDGANGRNHERSETSSVDEIHRSLMPVPRTIAAEYASSGDRSPSHGDEPSENSLSSCSEEHEVRDDSAILVDSTNRRAVKGLQRSNSAAVQKRSGIPVPRRKRPARKVGGM